MARIIYGVSGEGSGHSSRARVVLEHLEQQGHEVKVITYDRGYKNLSADFDVFASVGLHIVSRNNKVAPLPTLLNNLQKIPQGISVLQELRKTIFKQFDPQLVLTDFEPLTAYLAQHYDLPLISLDNQHRLRYMEYECPAELKFNRDVTVSVIRAMVPKPDVSLVTTFCFGAVKNAHTFLFPPLLRKEVTALNPTCGDAILVYLTSGYDDFIELLDRFPRERFIIYGQGDCGERGTLHFKVPSTDGFLTDLANCKAVMATAGFTLMTEALALGKPYLALPMAGQFEQEINAVFLEQIGCGMRAPTPTPDQIGAFLYRLPDFSDQLSKQPSNDNQALLTKLDSLIEQFTQA